MGKQWGSPLGRRSSGGDRGEARAGGRGLSRGKSVVSFEEAPIPEEEELEEERAAPPRSYFCPRPGGGSPRKRELDATSRNDLLNAFAKFSPASVHAELTDLGGSDSSFRSMSRKFLQKTFTEPSARMARGALLFVDISGFTRLSTSLGIEALKRHINAIYTRAVDIIVKHGGDVLKFAGDAMLITWLAPSDSEQALAAAVAAAASCALALQGPGSVHHVKEDGVDVHLSMHSSMGAASGPAPRSTTSSRSSSPKAASPTASASAR